MSTCRQTNQEWSRVLHHDNAYLQDLVAGRNKNPKAWPNHRLTQRVRDTVCRVLLNPRVLNIGLKRLGSRLNPSWLDNICICCYRERLAQNLF